MTFEDMRATYIWKMILRYQTFRLKNFQVRKNSSRRTPRPSRNSVILWILSKFGGNELRWQIWRDIASNVRFEEFWVPRNCFEPLIDHILRIGYRNNVENTNSTNFMSEIWVKLVGFQNKVHIVKSTILWCKTCFEMSNFLFLTIGMSSYKQYLPGTHPESRIFGHFKDFTCSEKFFQEEFLQ